MKTPIRAAWRLAAFGLLAITLEAVYAVLRPAPLLEEFDPSTVLGQEDGDPIRVLVLGDSSCTGPGVEDASQVWSRLICERMTQLGYRVELISLAKGGATSASVLREQLPIAEEHSADIAIISVGTNDLIRRVSLRRLESNLDEIVSRVGRVSRLVMLSGIGDLGTIPRLLPPLRHIVTRHARVADGVHSRVASRHGAVKVEQWGTAAQIFRSNRAVFSPDRFHPTATGHRAWADVAWEALEPALHRLRTSDHS